MKWFDLLLLVCLTACNTQDEVLSTPLNKEEFKEALKGALLVEARVNKERVDLKMDTIPIDRYYDAMFEEVGVSKNDFKETYAIYTEHLQAFEDLYEEVAAELSIETDSLQKLLN
jgi:hypothetical protein